MREQLLAYAVGVGTPEDDRATGADLGSRSQLPDEPLVADAEEHQVGSLVDGVQVGQARSPGDLAVAGVDQPHLLGAGRPEHLSDHPLTEAAGPAAGADHGHGSRLEHGRDGAAPGELLAQDLRPTRDRSRSRRVRLSASAARAACQPGMPQTPPPPWVAELAL